MHDPGQSGSIFNIPPARRRIYAALFVLFSLIGYWIVIWYVTTIDDIATDSTPAILYYTMVGLAIAHGAAFGLALVATEIIGGFMVIGDYLREKLRERYLKREARARDEANAEWRAWHERRRAAERLGQEFSEPPPDGGDSPV